MLARLGHGSLAEAQKRGIYGCNGARWTQEVAGMAKGERAHTYPGRLSSRCHHLTTFGARDP